ncbi:two-component system response regulator [Marinilabilia rubra]|uniref:Two-component system response regulator n=2 Tax=Marinilabilia rubra TaxID=2162893 RepID=A0A2U2B5K8_9BACT|nr:two-component system response regulator [Marinilabilia rubra]
MLEKNRKAMAKRIIIVDDSESTRYVVKLALAQTDATIIEASDGTEALELFDGRKVDLLITDFNMPEMNGDELIRAVRKNDNYLETPILLLTGKEKEFSDNQLMNELRGWIKKPFIKDSFVKEVKNCLYQESLCCR